MKPAFKLDSPETGTNYWIFVFSPDARRAPGPWPVVLFMDGDNQFEPAVAAYRALRKAKRIPPLLLVGVGYGASYGQDTNQRGRDYTPTHHSFEPASGGAKAFRKFLTATLWPELARRYPMESRSRGIAGYSLGSLLVLDALFQTKPFFTHYLAGSPSIWWDDRQILQQAKHLRARQATLHAGLFLSVGEKDSESMTGDLALLEAQLARKPFKGLDRTSRRFAGRDHFNALPDTFRAGLATLFGIPTA
jgi:predicted alpha/beta superfamily hydrolase